MGYYYGRKYDSCEDYVMNTLYEAQNRVEELETQLEELRGKAYDGELGPELDPLAYVINRPIEVVYVQMATRYTMRDKKDGFGMTSRELSSYLESDEKLKELAEKKIGCYWCKEPAMSIEHRYFDYYFEKEGRKVLLDIKPDEDLITAEFLHDADEDFSCLRYYPVEQEDEVEKSAMAEFRSRIENISNDLVCKEKAEACEAQE